jgi:hypothetical protein
VPHDHRNRDAQPADQLTRDYQFVRGRGHGVTLAGVVPFSLSTVSEPIVHSLLESRRSLPDQVHSASLFKAGAIAFFPVAMQLIPLVFAHCNGFEFWGADLSLGGMAPTGPAAGFKMGGLPRGGSGSGHLQGWWLSRRWGSVCCSAGSYAARC